MSLAEFIQFHLAHGGSIRDSDGTFLCWPVVAEDDGAAE